MSDLKEVKEKIISAIESAKNKGYTISSGLWIDELKQQACAMGSVIMEANLKLGWAAENAGKVLGKSTNWIYDFIHGFEGCKKNCEEDCKLGVGYSTVIKNRDIEAINLGKEIRKMYVEKA